MPFLTSIHTHTFMYSLRKEEKRYWKLKCFAQLHPTLCKPMDCSPPDSSVHGISETKILEPVAISFSGDLPNSEIKPVSLVISFTGRHILYHWHHHWRDVGSLPYTYIYINIHTHSYTHTHIKNKHVTHLSLGFLILEEL